MDRERKGGEEVGKIIGGEITRTFSRGEVERNIRVDYRQFNVNGATHGFLE